MLEVTGSTNPLATDSEKNDPSYGLKLLQAATNTWATGLGESRQARKARFDYNRSYALGKYDMNEFKDILDLDGEYSVVNLPYDPLTILKPYLNRLKDRYNQRDEVIQCSSIDPFLQNKKKQAKDAAYFKLRNAAEIQAIQQQAGVPLMDFNENDPTTEAEIDLMHILSFHVDEEIIMEDLINIVFYENDFSSVIKDRILDDLINCGYAGTKVFIDGTGRIKIKFIKPENLITSYTEWNDFRDWQYIGETYYKSITEIRLQYPGKVSEEKLYELSQTLVGKYGNPNSKLDWNNSFNNALARPYDAWRVPVVELDLKTLGGLTKSVVTNKFGKQSVVDDVTNPKADVSKVSSVPYYVQYTGIYIMDTDYLLSWGLSKNMVKPEQNLQEIVSQYSIYMYDNTEMTNKPLIEQLIPVIKEMTIYKLQQLKIVAAAAPDGFDIDVALMSDVMLDGTTTMSPMALYEVYKQTGNRYFKSIPDEGMDGGQRRVPIQANNVPFSGKLEELRNLYNAGLMTITNLISNQLDSGQITNQAVSQEVVKDAKSIGESTSNYIYDSFLNIMRRTAKVVQLRGWDILMYGKKFGIVSYDGYRQALGAAKIDYIKLQATDDWSKTAFDVQIKTVIGDADQNFLEQNIQQCLAQQTITIADAMDIRELAISNVRWAAYILSKRIDERAQKKQADAMALSQQNTQAAVQGAQAKSQGEMQLEQIQAVNKEASDLRNRETQLLIEQEKFSGILKANIVTAVLARPGATMADLPSFVFEGVPLQKAVDHANDMNYLQTMAQAAQAMQAQQVGAPQQQQDPNAQQPQADQSTQGLQNAPQEQQEPQQNAAA
jgi:hypothetical protein